MAQNIIARIDLISKRFIERIYYSSMRYLFLVRAHHWVKNLFLFIPAFFAGDILRLDSLVLLTKGFICFCLASSAIYILNDYRDRESDAKHPVKKNRPIASGKISPAVALSVMAVFAVVATAWSYLLMPQFLYMILLYVGVNVLYSFGLKDIPLVDVFIVSSGFVIRTVAGGILVAVFLSKWLIIMIFLLSLLMAFAKRRDDLILAQKSGTIRRKSSKHYTLDYVNICLSLIAGIIVVSYIMYTVSEDVQQRVGENYLYITALFVFGGILRYLQITLVKDNSGSPLRIFLTDRIIQVTVIGWLLAFFITLYI